MRSTGSWVALPRQLAAWPSEKTALSCVRSLNALGGPMYLASNPACGSATMAKCPSATCAAASRPHPAPGCFVACAMTGMSSSSAQAPDPALNLLCSCIIRPSEPVSGFDRTQNSGFENYTTDPLNGLAFGGGRRSVCDQRLNPARDYTQSGQKLRRRLGPRLVR